MNQQRKKIIDSFKEDNNWFKLDIVNDEKINFLLKEIFETEDFNDEHYRWRAFQDFFNKNKESLSSKDFEELYNLGGKEKDIHLGGSILSTILKSNNCPENLLQRALKSKQKHLVKIAFKKLDGIIKS
ncbi:MAG: hypothetical protein U0354_12415 [Candidatus Sericytochromatia bacterium]